MRLCKLSLEMHSEFLETSFHISDLVRQLVKLILTAILFASNFKSIANIIFLLPILFFILFIFISHKWGKVYRIIFMVNHHYQLVSIQFQPLSPAKISLHLLLLIIISNRFINSHLLFLLNKI